MARGAIESQAAPAAQGPLETQIQELASILIVACICLALTDPGVLIGAALAGGLRWRFRPALLTRGVCLVLLLIPLAQLLPLIQWAWPWRDWLASSLPGAVVPVDRSRIPPTLFVEALAGPLWLEATLLAIRLRGRTVDAQVRRDHRLDKRRWRALSGLRQPALLNIRRTRMDANPAHPSGGIRLGIDAETNGAFDLELPADLAAHVFLPGASGSGKTTTVTRLADGALSAGYGVVIVDCKAGSLGHAANALSTRYRVPFHLVDPDEAKSLGYNPCSGDAASVANKLVGAFTYSPSAEIYKNIAMEAVPVVVRGLQAANEPVTLDALYDAFGVRGMTKLAQKLPVDDPIHRRLLDLGEQNGDRAGGGGRAGLQHRLGALLEGKFGDLFRAPHVLDWDRALAKPSVTYIALSALASSEDVELMGRVVAQDLKQVCSRRIRQLGAGHDLPPVLAIFDEFAALDEAEQLADLLLQARQARMPVVISTQYLPETTSLRKARLGAGLSILLC
jgi:hypothetical protein